MQKNNRKKKETLQKIHIIGIDASGVADLSPSLKELVLSAKRLAAPARILEDFDKWWDKVASDKNKPELISTNEPTRLIKWIKTEDTKTIILSSGDPLWFGIGRLLSKEIPAEKLCFHPSTTSFQKAFAYLGRSWQDVSWVSIHGRELSPLLESLEKKPSALAILTDPNKGGIQPIREILRSINLEGKYDFWLFEQLGHKDQKVRKILPQDAEPELVNPLHIVLLIRKEKMDLTKEDLPLFGIEDNSYAQFSDRPGLMTKKEVRVQILSELELPKKGLLWDVCAGTGSIGLEAIRLRPELKLISIDKRSGSKLLIEENAKRLNVNPSEIYEIDALEFIDKEISTNRLLMPDRVILGGGGSKRSKILNQILKIINPGGIVVIPIITLNALSELEDIFSENNYAININQYQAYRGIPISEGTRFMPLNPIFIVKGKCKD